MGLVKNEFLEWEMDQPVRDWIEENYGLTEDDMDTAEWKVAMDDYDATMATQASLDTDDWYDPAEIKQLALRDYKVIYAVFSVQLMALRNMYDSQDVLMMRKMTISYGVTLMETFLQDLLMSVAISSDVYMRNALTRLSGLSGLKDISVPLSSLLTLNVHEYVTEEILKCLKEKLFHNISLVGALYRAILGKDASDAVCVTTGDAHRVVKLRHDIVHRNGKSADGTEHDISQQVTLNALRVIESYCRAIYEWTINDIEKRL